jgi:chromosome segregation ATPase
MRSTTLLRLAAVAMLLGLVVFATPAQDQNTDDVAAAARKAREQLKNAPKPKKVLTNDDIPSANTSNTNPTPEEAAAPKSEGQEAGADQATAGKNPEDDPKSELYWRKRFQKTRDKLAQAEKELDLLQRELDKDQVQYYPDPQKALMQQHDRSDISEKAAKIQAKQKEIDSLKQELSDMEDELRKAGGDPGWAR